MILKQNFKVSIVAELLTPGIYMVSFDRSADKVTIGDSLGLRSLAPPPSLSVRYPPPPQPSQLAPPLPLPV